MTSSEDVLLQVGQVRYKKGDGTLYVMNERLAWMMDHRDTVSVSHRYTDIRMQKISPEGKPKIQLQVVLHDGAASTFQFVNKEGHESQIKERDDVKQLLQQLLVKFKREINKELEEKNRLLSENPAMLQLYRDLVITQVITAEEFWMHHTSQFTKNSSQAAKQDIGVTGAFLADIKPQTDGCNGLKYNLTTDIIECIFKTFPAVRKKHLDQVPNKITEADFWTKFFQSHYFHRDRINTGTKDLFTDCAKLDDIELGKDIKCGIDDPLIDLTSFSEKYLIEGYGASMDKLSRSNGNVVHQNMIKRFNQHSMMVLKACNKETFDAPNVPATDLNMSSSSAIDTSTSSTDSNNTPTNHVNALMMDRNGSPVNHQSRAKKRRIQEKINYEELQAPSAVSTDCTRLELYKVDRYLHGPATGVRTENNVAPTTRFVSPVEMKAWNGVRGATSVSPASAVSALGELTPGGALMKGFREESLAR